MKLVYLDTNILVTLLKPDEPSFNQVLQILNQNHLQYVTGVITLIELASVISREIDNIHIDSLTNNENDFSFRTSDIVQFTIQYLVELTKINVLGDFLPEPIGIFEQSLMVNPISKLAISQSNSVKMRSLDNIHFATARYFNSYDKLQISYFLTADQEFLGKGKKAKNLSDMLFIDPTTLVELECS